METPYLQKLVEQHIKNRMRGDADKLRLFTEHERFPLFIKRFQMQLARSARYLGPDKTEKVIKDITDQYMRNTLRHLEERELSKAEKDRRRSEHDKWKDIENELDHERSIVEGDRLISRPGGVARHEAD